MLSNKLSARFYARIGFFCAFLLGTNMALAADPGKGQNLYMKYCASCHGMDGMAVMPGAPNFALNEGLLQADNSLLQTMRSGRNAMPAFQGVLDDEQLRDVIAFLRTMGY